MAGAIKCNDILEMIVKQNKEIERLRIENKYLVSENYDLSKKIAKWHNKYTKEKAKHDKATKMIDELL